MWKKGLSCNNQNLFTYHRYFLNKAKDFYGKQCPMCIFINTNDDSNNWIKKVLANSRWHTCEQIFNSMSAYYLIYVFFFAYHILRSFAYMIPLFDPSEENTLADSYILNIFVSYGWKTYYSTYYFCAISLFFLSVYDLCARVMHFIYLNIKNKSKT